MNLERDDQKLWRLIKQLNDEDIQRVTTPWKRFSDTVNGKQAAIRPSDNYEDVSYIPVNMEHQREARREQGEEDSDTKSDHIQECLTLSGLQAAQPVEKNKKSLDQMESQTKC